LEAEVGLDNISKNPCTEKHHLTGDVQPFVALGKELLKDGHRIRIASHETFRSFVTEAGLEFFDIGGNPHDMMSYMVKSWFNISL